MQYMITRDALPILRKQLASSAAVALLGPRQVGKTTLARTLGAEAGDAIYLDLERPTDLDKLADAERFLDGLGGRLVIIDEVHRLPGLFPILRGQIDQRRRAEQNFGQFLLLGSASLDLLKQSAESLAGRIAFVALTPLTIPEALANDTNSLETLWVRGGFPNSYLAASDEDSLNWRQNFISSYLERDILQFAGGISPRTMGRMLTMIAHAQGGLFNASRLSASLEVSARTVGRYVEILEQLLLLRTLRPWRANIGKRMVAAPKLYLRDSGLVHALLNIATREDLFGHPVLGASWEGLIIESIMAAAPRRATPWFYRTAAGAEIDLVLELSPGRLAAFEIKRSQVSSAVKRFASACNDISATHRFIVYAGSEGYSAAENVQVISPSEIRAIVEALN
jgi:uncharacterized protein